MMHHILRNRPLVLLLGILCGAFFVWFIGVSTHADLVGSTDAVADSAEDDKLPSRLWMEYTEKIVRAERPTPPESARMYAYVATAYADTLDITGSEEEASAVVVALLNDLVPSYSEKTMEVAAMIRDGRTSSIDAAEARAVKDRLIERMHSDGSDIPWDGTRPEGERYWNGTDPLSPRAGSWERWVVSADEHNAPPPPAWGEEVHAEALATVKRTSMQITPRQEAAVNFWGGVPGTVAPAGIWQNRLYQETRSYDLTDREYAYAQKILALALADGFMECWEEKYRYWTRRPSMDDPTISLAMPNPNFPSYVSGHSTISRAAAEVLSALFPEKKEVWMHDAREARDSRLWGGIHFKYDNAEGFTLGEAVGRTIVNRLEVSSLR